MAYAYLSTHGLQEIYSEVTPSRCVFHTPGHVLITLRLVLQKYPCFWPTHCGTDVHYGPLTVEMIEESFSDNIVSRLFRIKKVQTPHPY